MLGVPFDTVPANVDEERFASPATAKADAVTRLGTVTLAADTEVILEGERLGKPRDDGHALELLANLAGATHDVRTEVVVESAAGRRTAFADLAGQDAQALVSRDRALHRDRRAQRQGGCVRGPG